MPDPLLPLDLADLDSLLDGLTASLGPGVSDVDLVVLAELAARATPGPWEVVPGASGLSVVTSDLSDPVVDRVGEVGDEQAEADAAFVAFCTPERVRGLLARLAALECPGV